VLCVPTFKVNIVSETQLMSKGVSIYKIGNKVSLTDREEEVFMRGIIQNGLMRLQCQIVTPRSAPAFSFIVKKDWGIYNQRLGHPNLASTISLLRSSAILGVLHDELPPSNHPHDCKAFVKTKQTRASFPTSSSRCTRPMQLLHSNLMGVPSLGNSMYVATLMDDFSGYGEVFCLKDNKSVQQTLQYAMVRFQRQRGYQIKTLRTVRGTEYKNLLSAFMKEKGIVHERSSPYTPEQNGRAERYNRTLIERTHALLLHFNLSIILWGEAIVTALPHAVHTPHYLIPQLTSSISCQRGAEAKHPGNSSTMLSPLSLMYESSVVLPWCTSHQDCIKTKQMGFLRNARLLGT
jgi:hypothetical protein